MNNSRRVIATGAAALIAATALSGQARAAAPVPHYSMAQILRMTPTQQGALLDPLRELADALDDTGRTSARGIYTNVIIDAPDFQVDLVVTDRAGAQALIASARRTAPGIRTDRIKVVAARFTRTQLDAAGDQLAAQYSARQLSYHLDSVAPDPHGASLVVSVDNPVRARATARQVAARLASQTGTTVPLTFTQGHERHDLVAARPPQSPVRPQWSSHWGAVRWHDSSPQIAGDVIVTSVGYCTAGIPAVTGSGSPVLLTAGHCLPSTYVDTVKTGGGTPGQYVSPANAGGNDVGIGGGNSDNDWWDSAEIVGGNNNADESDTTTYKRITSDAYSHDGDLVCQDGAYSFFATDYGVPCNIQVTNQDIRYWHHNASGATVESRGVEGSHLIGGPKDLHYGGWAAGNGDSGGLVFSLTGSTVQARGQISAGVDSSYVGNNGYTTIDWTEAPDILGHYGLRLNPTT